MILKSSSALYFGLFAVICGVGLCRAPPDTMKLGGLSNTAGNNGEVENIGRFAVQQYNKNQNTLLEFGRIVNASEQVVSGKMYHLTLEAVDGGKNKMYEAKVWVKPWMNYKELQEFKEVSEDSAMG